MGTSTPETGASRWEGRALPGIGGDLPPSARWPIASWSRARDWPRSAAETGRILWKAAEKETVDRAARAPRLGACPAEPSRSNRLIRLLAIVRRENSLWTIRRRTLPVVRFNSPSQWIRPRPRDGPARPRLCGFLALRAAGRRLALDAGGWARTWRESSRACSAGPGPRRVLSRRWLYFQSRRGQTATSTWRRHYRLDPARPPAAPRIGGPGRLPRDRGGGLRRAHRTAPSACSRHPRRRATAPVLVGGRLGPGPLRTTSVVALTLDLSPAKEEAVGKPGGAKAKAQGRKRRNLDKAPPLGKHTGGLEG
jgi:hypothetical protein